MLAPRGRIPSIRVLAPIFGDIAYACFIYRFKYGYRARTPVSEFLRLINDNLDKHPEIAEHLNEEYRKRAARLCFVIAETIYESNVYTEAFKGLREGKLPGYAKSQKESELIFQKDIHKMTIRLMREFSL
jgi:hypothetical protein